MALWLDGLLFALAGVALPLLAVFSIGFLVARLCSAAGWPPGLPLLLTLTVFTPWLTLAVTRSTGLRIARLQSFLQPRGVGAAADWWLGLRWTLVIVAAAAVGRYAFRSVAWVAVNSLVLMVQTFDGQVSVGVTTIVAFIFIELPLWGLLARILGVSLSWRAGRSHERDGSPVPSMPPHNV